MATVSYIVHDAVGASAFYCPHLAFAEQMYPHPRFAMAIVASNQKPVVQGIERGLIHHVADQSDGGSGRA